MANRWRNNGNSDRLFLGSKITADGDCSHEIKWHVLLGRKAITNLDSILKTRDITLPTKVPLVKAIVYPVVMYRCENWTIKKAEPWRADAFELWYWRRLLRVPWTARKSTQSTLKEITLNIHWKDWSWSSNTLATWWEEPTCWKGPWCWETLRTGGGDDSRWAFGWKHWLSGRESEQTPGDGGGQGGLACCSPWGRKESDTTGRLSNTILICIWILKSDYRFFLNPSFGDREFNYFPVDQSCYSGIEWVIVT